MGKKKPVDDGEPSYAGAGGEEETSSATILTSLFASSNPFRRKDPAPGQESNKSSKRPIYDATFESELPIKKQRTHVEVSQPEEAAVDERETKKSRKKRKREEIELQYERKRYGGEAEEEASNPNTNEVNTEEKVVVGRKRKKDDKSDDKSELPGEPMSFDDEGKLLRTIFVGNLPLKMKRKAVLKEFAAFGEIESARIRSIPLADTKAPRKAAIIQGKVNETIDSVHAYIVFKDELSARAALAHNMAKIGGNHVRVDMACPPRKKIKGETPIYSVKKTVFVGNLPFDVKDEELYKLVCEELQMESSLEAVRVIRDPHNSLGKGIAYIMFKTREAANSLVRKKDIMLRDRYLRISHARSDTTPTKRKIENHGEMEYPNKHKTNYSGQAEHGPKVRASSLSYQGLRSSKSGKPKKEARAKRPGNADSRGFRRSEEKVRRSEGKVRSQKRPAVAARKAAQKQAQMKRKLDGSTPENPHRSKRARHS